jgi:hypothetical protein
MTFVEWVTLKGVIALGLLFAYNLDVGGVQCAHFFDDGVVGEEGPFAEWDRKVRKEGQLMEGFGRRKSGQVGHWLKFDWKSSKLLWLLLYEWKNVKL